MLVARHEGNATQARPKMPVVTMPIVTMPGLVDWLRVRAAPWKGDGNSLVLTTQAKIQGSADWLRVRRTPWKGDGTAMS